MARRPNFTVGKDHGSWYVNVSATRSDTGRRERLYYTTKKEAVAKSQQLNIDHENHGSQAAKIPQELSIDAAKAAKLLEPHGATLTDAARYYTAWREELARSVTFEKLVESYIAKRKSLTKEGRRTYEKLSKDYSPRFEGKVVAEIEPEELEAVIDARDFSAESFNTHRAYLSALFNHAVDKEFASRNITRLFDRRKDEAKRPTVLTYKQAAAFMKAAQAYEAGILAPYFAVCLFAGLRPQREAGELGWGAKGIDLNAGHIYVNPGIAKTATDRYVPIERNLRAWLNILPRTAKIGTVLPESHRYGGRKYKDAFDDIRTEAKIKELWSKQSRDIFRHSFCSYHFGKYKDAGKLTEAAGHTISTNLKHYRRAITPAAAKAFWKISPGQD